MADDDNAETPAAGDPSTTTATAAPAPAATTRLASLDLACSRLGLDPALNQFHAPLVYHEEYSFPGWPEKHTFPMNKFARIAHALLTHETSQKTTQNPHRSSPLACRRPLVGDANHFFRPLDFPDVLQQPWLTTTTSTSSTSRSNTLKDTGHSDAARVDTVLDADFVERFLRGQLSVPECRTIGFGEQTRRPELIKRTVLEVAGTVLACQLALHYGVAANVAGGTHHAHRTGGAGYTILNDLAVASHVLLTTNTTTTTTTTSGSPLTIQRVLIVDCDVHQGDGTAKFSTEGVLKDKLFTLSLHCASNYPHPKANSTIDVGLPDGMVDEDYLAVLEESLTRALELVQPDFVIYDAGVDIYEHDVLGRLDVTEDGIRKRDRHVLDRCVSSGIPVAAVVGGGYDKDIDALARRHAIVHEEAAFVWRKYKMWKRA